MISSRAEVSLGEHGLLAGADGAFYSPRLPDLRAAGALVERRGLLWAAAEKDAAARGQTCDEYVADVEKAADAFFDSKEVAERAATMDALEGLLAGGQAGALVLLLGARDVYKSNLVHTLPARLAPLRRRVVVVSGRSIAGDLAGGVVDALGPDSPFHAERQERIFRSLVAIYAAAPAPPAAAASSESASFARALAAALPEPAPEREPPALRAVLESFIAVCEARGDVPVLVVDEASLVLSSPRLRTEPGDWPEPALDAHSAEVRARSLECLGVLTQLSKDAKRLNVLLVASELAELARLEALGYDATASVTQLVIAESDLTPAVMRAMLVDKWRCGPALAEGLAAVYGGHVVRARRALWDLEREKAGFAGVQAFASDMICGVLAC